jgi:hypothetical protein
MLPSKFIWPLGVSPTASWRARLHSQLSSLKGRGAVKGVLSCFDLGVDSAEPTPVSRWSARSAARTNDLDDGGREVQRNARLKSKPMSIGGLMWLWCNVSTVMRVGWGRAETSAAGHPFAPQRGHGAVRVQHAGSIKTATTPRSGGQTIERPRACYVRDAHAATGRWATARMCSSRSP